MLAGVLFLSCSNKTTQGRSTTSKIKVNQDTTQKNIQGRGNTIQSQQTNTLNPVRDTVPRTKTAIMNNGENQAVTDSIKALKTKKKK
jgi:hypothetical protein